MLKYVRQRPGFTRELADFISNPREHYYDVPGLLAVLDRAGLRSVRPKVTLRHDDLWFDAGERRPAVVHYGQAEDCITEEPRKRLRLADKGLSTVFNHHQLSRLLTWSEPCLLPQALAEKFFTAYPDARLSPSQFYQGLLTLCRTPFRLFALQSPALPQSVSRDAVEKGNRPPVA